MILMVYKLHFNLVYQLYDKYISYIIYELIDIPDLEEKKTY